MLLTIAMSRLGVLRQDLKHPESSLQLRPSATDLHRRHHSTHYLSLHSWKYNNFKITNISRQLCFGVPRYLGRFGTKRNLKVSGVRGMQCNLIFGECRKIWHRASWHSRHCSTQPPFSLSSTSDIYIVTITNSFPDRTRQTKRIAGYILSKGK